MLHFQTLSSLSKGFRCGIAHPGVLSFISKLHGPGPQGGVSAKQTHGPWGVWWQGPRGVLKETYRSCTSVLERYKSCCYLLLPVATSFSVAGFPSTISLQHCSGHDSVRMLMTFGGELTAVLAWCFLDLPYHKGRCHCAVPSCKPCHRHIWCCDLGISGKKSNTQSIRNIVMFGELPTLHRPLFEPYCAQWLCIVRVRTLEVHSLGGFFPRKSVFNLAWENPRMRIWVLDSANN